jgi:2-phosphoglycerate kinase
VYTTVEFPSKDELIDEYKKDCAIVRKGVTSDIDKCLKEGKSLVIEGFHLDPRLYQKEVAAHSAETQGAVSGIVVPFLLTLDEKNHLEFMTNSPDPRYRSTQATTVGFRNLQDVQSYLGEPDTAAFTRIAVNVHSFHETLDLMHDAVLKRIEAVYKTQQ